MKSICCKGFGSVLGIALLFSANVTAAEEIQWFPYPETGVNLGQGFDLLTGAPTPGSCIEFEPNYDDGLSTSIAFTEINSFVDTMSSMQISGSGKLSLALLEASASLRLANESRVTRSFQDVGVNARVFLGASYVAPTVDTKYPADGDGSTLPEDGEGVPAITFTDLALDEWPGLGDATTSDEVSAFTICGSGYVSTVISGVELNAILSTEDSSYDDNASFAGELRAKILGGLATIQANVEGTSEAQTEFQSIRVNAQITGKSNYAIPLNGDSLQAFIRDLPKDLEGNARPILIAVTPYGNLFPEVAGAYTTASDFSVLADSWFIAREARSRYLETINGYGNRNVAARDHFVDKTRMHELVEAAFQVEDLIQQELRILVNGESDANNLRVPEDAVDAAEATSDVTRTIYDDMVAAREARKGRVEEEIEAVSRLIDRGTLERLNTEIALQAATSEELSIDDISAKVAERFSDTDTNTEVTDELPPLNGLAGIQELTLLEERILRGQDYVRSAMDLYVGSLLSAESGSIELDYLLTAGEKRGFELALRILMRGEEGLQEDIEGLTDPELFDEVALLLEQRDQCMGEAGRIYLEGRKQAAVVGGTSILVAVADRLRVAYDDRLDACEAVYKSEFDELQLDAAPVDGEPEALTTDNASDDVRYLSEALFIDVVARHVYEDRFLPIKVSACDNDPQNLFCAVNSFVVREIVDDLIDPTSEYVTARALPLFGFDIGSDVSVPSDNLNEIDRLPTVGRPIYHGENCGGNTGIYCP